MRRIKFKHAAKVVAIVVLALCVFSVIVMLLWNALLPDIFGLRTITFPQALGLLVLTRILVGVPRGRGAHKFGGHRRRWQRWQQMTPEERERLKAGLCARFGDDRHRHQHSGHEHHGHD